MALMLGSYIVLVAIKYKFPNIKDFPNLLLSETTFKILISGFLVIIFLAPLFQFFRCKLIWSETTELFDCYLEKKRVCSIKRFSRHIQVPYTGILYVYVYNDDLMVVHYKKKGSSLPQAFNLYFPSKPDKFSFLQKLNKKIPAPEAKLALRTYWIEKPKKINFSYFVS